MQAEPRPYVLVEQFGPNLPPASAHLSGANETSLDANPFPHQPADALLHHLRHLLAGRLPRRLPADLASGLGGRLGEVEAALAMGAAPAGVTVVAKPAVGWPPWWRGVPMPRVDAEGRGAYICLEPLSKTENPEQAVREQVGYARSTYASRPN